MVWIYSFCALLILFFLIRNLVAHQQYRQYKNEALFAFDDHRPIHQISRIVFGLGFLFFAGELAYTLVTKVFASTSPPADLSRLMTRICLLAGCALFAFVPYSSGKWLVLEKGIYICDYHLLLSFEEMIAAQLMNRGKKTFLLLKIRKLDKELIKKDSYALLIPPQEAKQLLNLIREFIALEDRAREKQRRNSLQQEV